MSHKKESIICPNCGYHATENYCARCGQETHLHEDTFGKLIMHFIGHYFHYDSKFWQTLKALWFSPGRLTIAYLQKQRMRYIPPISLYIFVSVVFFLVSSYSVNRDKNIKIISNKQEDQAQSTNKADSLHVEQNSHNKYLWSVNTGVPKHSLPAERAKEHIDEIQEKFIHNFPKVFFFMIPFLAFLLQLLFIRNKELFYVHHVIFALHIHSFWFSIMTIGALYPFEKGSNVLSLALLIIGVTYFMLSTRSVYHTSLWRSFLYTVTIGILYGIVLMVASFAVFLILFRDLLFH